MLTLKIINSSSVREGDKRDIQNILKLKECPRKKQIEKTTSPSRWDSKLVGKHVLWYEVCLEPRPGLIQSLQASRKHPSGVLMAEAAKETLKSPGQEPTCRLSGEGLGHLCPCLEKTVFQGAAGWRLAGGCTGKSEACSSLGWCLRTTESTAGGSSEVGTSCEFTGMFWTHSWSRMLMDAGQESASGSRAVARRETEHTRPRKSFFLQCPSIAIYWHSLILFSPWRRNPQRGLFSYQRAGNEGQIWNERQQIDNSHISKHVPWRSNS